MSRLPFMQFFPADWLQDCQVLTLAARGAWQTVICKAWHPSTRGVVRMKLGAWSRLFSCTCPQAERVIKELEESGVADVKRDGDEITIRCRRIVRDWAKAVASTNALSNAGRKGAAKRWHPERRTKTEAPQENTPMPSEPIAIPEPISSLSEQAPIAEDEAPPTALPEAGVCVELKPEQPLSHPQKPQLQLRAETLMRRRVETPLTRNEARVFAQNRPAIEATTELEWQALEAFYAAPQGETFARKDLTTLVNNWNGEIDRAKVWLSRRTGGGGGAASSALAPPLKIPTRIPHNLRPAIAA